MGKAVLQFIASRHWQGVTLAGCLALESLQEEGESCESQAPALDMTICPDNLLCTMRCFTCLISTASVQIQGACTFDLMI